MQVCPVLGLCATLSSFILTYCNFLPSGFLEVPLVIHHVRIRFLIESHNRVHMECASTCNPTHTSACTHKHRHKHKHVHKCMQVTDSYCYSCLSLQDKFHVKDLNKYKIEHSVVAVKENNERLASAVYLQVSIISQALIFVTRSQGWSFLERPGLLLLVAFIIAQMVFSLRH